ncbi:glycosyltransferase family 4 protein [Nostocaceae cyanobacterium CENA369]|uniref:Glycosyltransferase family 4 protein n=1 Tax=Dendronalium phyllosphericum CENA369 TaxID=1725256 RepID=A0A8J7IJU6_9NOST|nr:glycosyltransferase family 4 protein [Dendronalium phyllosphericum]MBH8576317.1 glycosyltransferase family 4 protein [Dendronalium phyllosphericum CENA369]
MKKILISGILAGEGGIQTHLNWLANALEEEKIDTAFIVKKPIEERSRQYAFVKFFSFESSDEQQNKSIISFFQKINKIKTIIEEFAPDVYIAVGTGFYSVIPVCLVRHKPRTIFHEVMSGLKSGWKDPRWIVRWYFDEVAAHTPTVAANFANCFGWKKEIPVLSAIPVPLEIVTSLPQPVYKKVPLGQAKAALFSRLVPHKRAFWLVQQWESLKDVLSELHIHGGGPEEPLIREYIEAQGIGDRVKCFGRYPEGQAYVDLISSYDLTLLPTLGDEGAPLVLLESLACGVPFVTYGVGGIADYGVGNPNVIIVPPEPWQNEQANSTNNSFINAVRKMLFQLAEGEINQVELQKYYLDRYSYSVLKKAWLSYLCG